MYKSRKKDNNYINSNKNSKEAIANRYAINCLTCAMVVLVIILFINLAGIFTIDVELTKKCVLLCFIVYCSTVIVKIFVDLSNKWVKYYVILALVVWITIVSTFLTYHALLVCALPIVSCSVYVSRRVTVYTYILMVISTCISVFGGYFIGICDSNMVLLTGEPLSSYLSPDKEFIYRYINDSIVGTLTLFYVIPRCMILLAFSVVSSGISKIINLNMDYARKMENRAEMDGMTELYNRTKYNSMVEEVYKNEKQIGVIFWDINFLKQINDNEGHEHGDLLIRTVAQSINKIATENNLAYRIGGDEFVMVIPDADKRILQKKISEWRRGIDRLKKDSKMNISVAVGYAYGNGNSFDEVVREADKMMYEDKERLHNI